MLKKCLRYDLQAVGRLWCILSVISLGAALVTALAVRIFLESMFSESVSETMSFLSIIGMLGAGLCLLAMIATLIASLFLVYWRTYTNFFTDEGYLTFTLPATPSQLFLSSYVNILIWTLISGAAIALSVFLAALFGPAKDSLLNLDVLSVLGEALKELSDEPLWGLSALPVVSSLFCNPLISMSCITVGAVLAKKHKLLAAFGIYYAFSALSGFAGTVLMFMASLVSYRSGELFLILSSVLPSLLQIGAAVGGSFLSVHLMKNKLNLP